MVIVNTVLLQDMINRRVVITFADLSSAVVLLYRLCLSWNVVGRESLGTNALFQECSSKTSSTGTDCRVQLNVDVC